MRLVVLSEEEKRSVLTECHNNPGTGNHSGVRGTQNRVIGGYYWPTIIQDVKEWVMYYRCGALLALLLLPVFFLYKYLYLRMCLILPPLIVRYLLDLERIFIVINLYQVAVFLDIVFKKNVLLFRSDPVTAAS